MSAGLDPIEFIPGLTIGTIELDFIEQTRAFCHQSLSGRQGLMESFYEMTVAPPDRCVDLYGRCLSHVARLEELRTTGYFAVRRPHKSVLSDLSLALREQSAVATSAAFDPQAVGEGVCPRFRHGLTLLDRRAYEPSFYCEECSKKTQEAYWRVVVTFGCNF